MPIISGSELDNVLVGTPEDDTIQGLGGNDTIDGGTGADVIDGGSGNDTVHGGIGNDTLLSSSGADQLYGDIGDDTIKSTSTAAGQRLDGGDGHDTISLYGATLSAIAAGSGQDTVTASGSRLTIDLGAGRNFLRSLSLDPRAGSNDTPANDIINSTITGGDDGNIMRVRGGGNSVTTGAGDDNVTLQAIGSTGTINTGAGNDRIDAQFSNGTIRAGAGDDRVFAAGNALTIDLGDGANSLANNQFGQAAELTNSTITGGSGRDGIWITGGGNTINAGDGDNYVRLTSSTNGSITTGSGNDLIDANFSNGTINVGAGDDNVTASGTNLTITLDSGYNRLSASNLSNSRISGGDDRNYINFNFSTGNQVTTGAGIDAIVASDSTDLAIATGAGDDVVRIYSGSTGTVNTGAGADEIDLNGSGVVTVNAGAGADRITMFAAPALVTGGADTDTYVLSVNQPNTGSRILDFTAGDGGDVIDTLTLFPYLYRYDNTLPNLFASGQLRLMQSGADTLVQAAETPGSFVTIVTLANVTATSLTAFNFHGMGPDGLNHGSTINGTAGNDILTDGFGADLIQGGAGDDEISIADANDTADGGDGNDVLYSGLGSGTLLGGNGNDLLFGFRSGNLTADGGTGNDVLYIFGSGSVLTGGAGKDLFRLFPDGPVGGSIVITDFAAGNDGDSLDVSSLIPGLLPEATDAFGLGYIRLVQSGADTLVQIDKDGSAGPAGITLTVRLRGVTASALTAHNFWGYGPDGSISGEVIDGTTWAGNATGKELWGTIGDDTITGSSGDDSIDGYAGVNHIEGGAGNDFIGLFGDAAGQFVSGGDGNDEINFYSAGGISDGATVLGGEGDDRISLDPEIVSHAYIDLGNGQNELYTSKLDFSEVHAGSGDDGVELGAGNNTFVDLGDGDNGLGSSGTGVRVISGSGIDSLSVGAQASVQSGGGDDYIDLGGDGTEVFTGEGNDSVGGNARGQLYIDLGNGDNEFAMGGSVSQSQIYAGSGADAIDLGNGSNNLIDGGDGENGIIATGAGNRIITGSGFDGISAGADAVILAGNGTNYIDQSGDGARVLTGSGADTITMGNLGVAATGDGDDYVLAGNSNLLMLGSGADTVELGSLNTVMLGEGDDTATINGTDNRLVGGTGSETYNLGLGSRGTRIKDFSTGTSGDVLNIALTYNFNPFATGFGQIVQSGADTIIYVDRDGAGSAYNREAVVYLRGVTATQLTAASLGGLDPTGAITGTNNIKAITDPAGGTLVGDGIPQQLDGGNGNDTITSKSSNDTVHGGLGDDTIIAGPVFDAAGNPVGLTGNYFGNLGNDLLISNGFAQRILLSGGTGDDEFRIDNFETSFLNGGVGNDTVWVRSASGAQIDLGSGNNKLRGVDSTTTIAVDDTVIIAADGNDEIVIKTGSDNVINAGDGDNTVIAGDYYSLATDTVIQTGNGNDHIETGLRSIVQAGDGDDFIAPGVDSVVNAGAGDDSIEFYHWSAFGGGNVVTGGSGRDSYHFNSYLLQRLDTDFSNTITDFAVGPNGDVLRFDELSVEFQIPEGTPISEGWLIIEQHGADTVILFDADGSGNNHDPATLVTLRGVDASTLTAENLGGLPPDGSVPEGRLIEGDDDDNSLFGGFGDDTILGKGGNDEIRDRLAGNDTIDGGSGNDYIESGSGDDVIHGGDDDDYIEDTSGANQIYGDAGNDEIHCYSYEPNPPSEGQYISGGEGDDSVEFVRGGQSTIDTGDGDDYVTIDQAEGEGFFTILLGSGNNAIEGTLSDSTISAAGNGENSYAINGDRNVLRGADGADNFNVYGNDTILTGGLGQDSYFLYPDVTNTRITDFKAGALGDVLDLAAIDFGGSDPFAAGYLRLKQVGTDTVIELDRDGSEGTEFGYTALVTLNNVYAVTLTAENLGGYEPPVVPFVALNAAQSLAEDSAATGNALSAGSAPDQTTYVLVSGPANGSLTFRADGTWRYDPVANFNGADSFTFRALSGGRQTDVATVSLTVSAVNDAPTIVSNGGGDSAALVIAEGTTAVTTVRATDVDAGTSLTYSISGADAAKFAIDVRTGVLSFKTAPSFASPADVGANNIYDVIVSSTDGQISDSQALAVQVSKVVSGSTGGKDVLAGTAGADWIDGGAGSDTMTGGGGNDTYVVDSKLDRIVEKAGEGVDTVRTSLGTYTLGKNLDNLIFTNDDPHIGKGNELANWLVGGNGNDSLNGLAGADVLEGRGGNDTFTVDNAGDTVVEATNGGTDSVIADISHTLAANVENLTLNGKLALNGTGNAQDNAITGNSLANVIAGAGGNDTLNGLSGNDVIDGGTGNDVLDGGAGRDILTGGAGMDVFRFSLKPATTNVDSLTDFTSGIDKLGFSLAIFKGFFGTGAVSEAAFWSGAGVNTAHDADDRLIYNTTTDQLWYDADGTGRTKAVLVATLDGNPDLAFSDLIIVA